MFNLRPFERKIENKKIDINNKEVSNPDNMPNMAHYEELSLKLGCNEMGIAENMEGAKNRAMELCKNDPEVVKLWAEEKDPVIKEAIFKSILNETNKDQN